MTIPKIIHQLFESSEKLPEYLKKLSESWIKYNPDWKYMFWAKKDMDSILQEDFPDFIETYRAFPYNIQRWDAMRYLILCKYGGLYVDIDYECFNSINGILKERELYFGLEPEAHAKKFNKDFLLGNAFIASVPKHPFWRFVIQYLTKLKPNDYKEQGKVIQILETTGPFMINKIFDNYEKKNEIGLVSDKLVAPLSQQELLLYENSRATAEMRKKVNNAFAIHYFKGTWYSDNENNPALKSKIIIPPSSKKKNIPAISVVMSMYNSGKYVKECIESVLNQTFDDFEFIIVDDGSEDSSVKVVESFRDSRIKLVKNKHDFIDSLNKGMSLAKGEFIARMDPDDIMFPERLEIQYDFMLSNPQIDVCSAWAVCFGLANNNVQTPTEHKKITSDFLFHNPVINPTSFIRRSSIQINSLVYKYYDYAEDYKLWVDCAGAGLKFSAIPRILLKYRTTKEQVTRKYYKEMMQSSHLIKLEYARFVATSIAKKEKAYTELFKNLFDLANMGYIDFTLLLNVLHNLYLTMP